MKHGICTVVLSLVLISTATAGKNAGGALVVHTDDTFHWRNSDCYWFDEVVPQDCELLNTRTDLDENSWAIIWFIAAFDSSSTPAVSSVTFGNNHNLPVYQHRLWGYCGPIGTVEDPDPGWPESPTSGNRVVFSEPIVGDFFFPVYWVEVYGFDGAYYGTGVHPGLGYAAFTDDSNPPVIEQVDRFGLVCWYRSGHNVCPGYDPLELAACCFENGDCWHVFDRDCPRLGGESLGAGTDCDPNPCGQAGGGVCCLETGECRVETELECEGLGGTFFADEPDCDPNPCPQPPVAVCCLQSGDCRIETEAACAYLAGIFLEGTTECTPDPCYGACCFYSGECQMQPLYWCEPMGGEFMGAGSDCDPNPCVNSSVPEMLIHETTWGAIKARYR